MSDCAVPGCANCAFDFGVCWTHRFQELKAGGTPSGHELDQLAKSLREEQELADRRRREQFSAALRINDDGWDGHTTRYGRKALMGIVDDVLNSTDGRNNALFRGTARIAGLVASGHVQESVAEEMLTNAGLARGLDQYEVRQCVRSGMRAGKDKPWGPKDG